MLAQLEELAAQNQELVLAHMKRLGLRLNLKKSLLSPKQRSTFLGIAWDSTTMQAHLSPGYVDSILTVRDIKLGQEIFHSGHHSHGLGCSSRWLTSLWPLAEVSNLVAHKLS